MKRTFAPNQIFASTCICLHQIKYLYANLCEYFEANVKRMMRINGVCEYSETCKYEANKIHIGLDSPRSELKKFDLLHHHPQLEQGKHLVRKIERKVILADNDYRFTCYFLEGCTTKY